MAFTLGPRVTIAAVSAATAGVLLAILITNAGADSPPTQTVTLGSVTGNPTASECPASVNCTYIPFDGNFFEIAPFDGTITSFSVNSGSAGGNVELRVVSSATPSQQAGTWTGVGSGPVETLKAGINTFAVNIPVKHGEVIALDNDSGSPIFDKTSPSAQYGGVTFFAPALPDGVTGEANVSDYSEALLMSATVVSGTSAPTTTTLPGAVPPIISRVFESNRSWRETADRDAVRRHTPVGTTFGFVLNQLATVTIAFTHQLSGRRSGSACVAQNRHNRRAAPCARVIRDGTLVRAGHPGLNTVSFRGRLTGGDGSLATGGHVATIIAHNAAGEASDPVGLAFTILSK